MADKKYYEAFISPAGTALYPWLNKADVQHDKEGVFHTDLVLPPELCEEFISRLEGVRDAFAAEELTPAKRAALVARPVYREELTRPEYPDGATDAEKKAIKDAFIPEPTGNYQFRFKMKARVHAGNGTVFEQRPVVVLAETGERVDEPVFTDSVIRVKGQIVPYTNDASGTYGVSLRLKAVQVIELVTGTGGGAFWSDFENE
jgi:hypothetical protein